MKTADARLISHARTPGAIWGICDLIEIVPWNGGGPGTVIRWTTNDRHLVVPDENGDARTFLSSGISRSSGTGPSVPLTLGLAIGEAANVVAGWGWGSGSTFPPATLRVPIIERSAVSNVAGIETSSFTMVLHVTAACKYGTVPLAYAASNGLFRKAWVRIDRHFMGYPCDTSLPPLFKYFSGYVADYEANELAITLTIKDARDRLNIPLPRNLFQPICGNVLGDAGCGITVPTYSVTVSAGATQTSIPCSIAGAPGGATSDSALTDGTPVAGYWTLGIVTFTSGTNAGFYSTVSACQGAGSSWTLTLPVATLVTPTAGDTFTITPGCDRTLDTCNAKFGNLANFAGEPFVPHATSMI